MRPAIVLLVAFLLSVPLAPAREAVAPDPPAWLVSVLEARGVPREEWGSLVVERRAMEENAWRVEAAALTDLPRALQPGAPHVVLGTVREHVMVQVGHCDGYDVQPLAQGVVRVGGSWDVGFHVVTLQQGSPGVDAADPHGSVTSYSLQEDVSLAGVGEVRVAEHRVSYLGQCVALLGTLKGTGVFAFDEAWPP